MSKAQWLLFVSEMFVWFPPRILVVKQWWVQSLASSPRMLYTALQKVLPYISQFKQLQKRTVVSVCSELSTAASKLYGRGRKQIQFSKEKTSNNLFFFVNQDACLQLLNCKCKKVFYKAYFIHYDALNYFSCTTHSLSEATQGTKSDASHFEKQLPS